MKFDDIFQRWDLDCFVVDILPGNRPAADELHPGTAASAALSLADEALRRQADRERKEALRKATVDPPPKTKQDCK